MTDTTTRYRVLDAYTDEHIDNVTEGRTDRWADAQRALKTVSIDWRQSVWAAARSDAYRAVSHLDRSSGMYVSEDEPTGIDLNDAIRNRVDAFHLGQRPRRMETPISDADPGAASAGEPDASR